ncbi:MAG: triose-phosphate isomerase [Nitrososphaerota archaeon]|nr:triose-phosphate isomerase [Nitrososphaerota archaeon]
MRYLLLNLKNYTEVLGSRLDQFLSVVERTSIKNAKDVEISVALPAFYLAYAHSKYPRARCFAQHLDNEVPGSTTGFLVPEIARQSGAVGTLVNHSEHRLDIGEIASLTRRLHELGIISVVCAKDPAEVASFAKFSPDFIAIEPPELIGTGNAVSKSRPEVISESYWSLVRAKRRGSRTRLLCGAGIVNGTDAKSAIELGASGILVASGVVKSRNWSVAVQDLVRGLSDAKRTKSDLQWRSESVSVKSRK